MSISMGAHIFHTNNIEGMGVSSHSMLNFNQIY